MSVITLAHGNGGRKMRELISKLFLKYLANFHLNTATDASILDWPQDKLAISTDGFTVNPLFFPNTSIGALSIHGTINDLAVSGAMPCYLTLNAFIEEGLEIAILEKILQDMAQALQENNTFIVAGDTKVLPKKEVNQLYLATTGIGIVKMPNLGLNQIKPGDKILINGSIGDHGSAVMLARESFGLQGDIISDAASVLPFTQALWDIEGIKFMRDPTRGGLATVMHEIAQDTQYDIKLFENKVPIKEGVQVICEMLGYDAYYLACEGRVCAIVEAEQADYVLSIWQSIAPDAAIIGEVENTTSGQVTLETHLGGLRMLPELISDPLPRIC